MDISYLGHSSFRIKTKSGILVTDPYAKSIGLSMPSTSADVVTISHHQPGHDNISAVSGTSRRDKPFVIDEPGEYEVEGISVFGYQNGNNVIYLIQADELRLLHLGGLKEQLKQPFIEEIGSIDVLFVPVGGTETLKMKDSLRLVEDIAPAVYIPMHYRTPKHTPESMEGVPTLAAFLAESEAQPRKIEDNKYKVEVADLAESDMDLVVFE